MMHNFNITLQNTQKANQRPCSFNTKLQHTNQKPSSFKAPKQKKLRTSTQSFNTPTKDLQASKHQSKKNLEPQHKASTHKLAKDLRASMHQSRELEASTYQTKNLEFQHTKAENLELQHKASIHQNKEPGTSTQSFNTQVEQKPKRTST